MSKQTAYTSTTQAKRETRQQKRQQRRVLYGVIGGAVGLALAAALGSVVWSLARPKLGESVSQQPRTHIQVGDPHEPYNTDPPTSGAHATTVREGFYDGAPPDENLVHNLEHGYVVIWYNCSGLDEAQCQTLKTQIQSLMERASPAVIASDIKKLVAVPRPDMDTQLALTSWGRFYKLAAFDETVMLQFISDFRNQAPEPGAP